MTYSTNWTMDLDLDVERLPREWWAEGEDDALPDDLGEDEAWALIRRSGAPPHRALDLASDYGFASHVRRTRPSAITGGTTQPACQCSNWASPPLRSSVENTVCSADTATYLTQDQAAAYLNVTPRLIRRMSQEGRLVVTKVGRFNRYTKEDLDAATKRVAVGGALPPYVLDVDESTSDPIEIAVLRATKAAREGRKQERRMREGQ